ncbi:unnamed protein product [Didymodactylos carnosus]|uniref:Uncharacterized protein n=1 Tax=Didymodactylos carnosus TaxID=1234261 RepID=A0A814GUL1_9BILA|nr:unnamed protein product [Didymodactylos carnosus]CAF1122241.1 unnamed protein product [Didymodactylos carnosus]CAF3772612.1 unnamed protein product [Didymodactylos carnosus]CAF3897090.1 unnamed protein product [Didymodactylos carnosus]
MRRFLVWPSDMIWPYNLPFIAYLRTVHEPEAELSSKWLNLTRWKFFVIATVLSAVYYWLPGYIMPVLSNFSWMCMIDPQNVLLAQLTGSAGFALGTLQLDWYSLQSRLGSPIVSPSWAQYNILAGYVLVILIIMPIMYYINLWNFKSFPISDSNLLAGNGTYYNGDNPPIRFSVGIIVSYMLYFASLVAMIMHTILYHGTDVLRHAKTSLRNRQNDIHCTLMSKYPDAPGWVYGILFLCAFVCACFVCKFGKLMPWYLLFLAITLSFVCLLPTGIIWARTNIAVDVSYLCLIIGGLLMHGNGTGNKTFVTYAFGTQFQALFLLRTLKFGHFMKISPRALFSTQLIITLISCVVRYGIAYHMLSTIEGICDTNVEWPCFIQLAPLRMAIIG